MAPPEDLVFTEQSHVPALRSHDELRDRFLEAFSANAAKRGADIRVARTSIQLGSPSPLRPDALIQVTAQGYLSSFFLEVDQSTQRLRIVIEKCRRYLRARGAGEYAKYCGLPRSAARDRRFRVIFLVRSEARARNIALELLRRLPAASRLVWFLVIGNGVDPYADTWHSANDYADTSTTPILRCLLRNPEKSSN